MSVADQIAVFIGSKILLRTSLQHIDPSMIVIIVACIRACAKQIDYCLTEGLLSADEFSVKLEKPTDWDHAVLRLCIRETTKGLPDGQQKMVQQGFLDAMPEIKLEQVMLVCQETRDLASYV